MLLLICLLHHGATPDKNNEGLFPHQVVRGIHAEECQKLIEAYMYKLAKKKLDDKTKTK